MSRLSRSAISGSRAHLGLMGATIVALSMTDAVPVADHRWSLALAGTLAVAWALVEKTSRASSSRASVASAPPDVAGAPTPGEIITDSPACATAPATCWPAATMRALLEATEEVTSSLEVSEVANILVRRACDLLDASAAWVYRIEEDGRWATPIASFVQPAAGHRRNGTADKVGRLVEEVVLSACQHGMGDRQASRLFSDGNYVAIPLMCQQRVHSVLAIQGPYSNDGPPLLQEKLLAALAAQAMVALENAQLHESLRDTLAKLRQLEVHRISYVAMVSHELRTPLTSIKGFAQLLTKRRELLPLSAQSYAGTIATEAEKLTRIVDDIIDLMRMETDLLKLRRSPVSVSQAIRDAVQALQPTVPSQYLQISLPDQLPPVRSDPKTLDQVLGTLVVDAMSRSRPGSTILVGARADDEGVTIQLQYQTTRDRIESLATALDGPSQCDGQATQLGQGKLVLYICKNYIEAHGGRMWVECPEEQVARVAFTLPY